MKNSKSSVKQKNYKPLLILIYILILTVSLFAFAGLTKAGYIPNYLEIKLLSPNESEKSESDPGHWVDSLEKPVIYLYPEEEQEVRVQLDYKGQIIADYPEYDESIKGWKVIAYPDGRIINLKDNHEYSYLFWEGRPDDRISWDLSTGFVVRGTDTREFLQKKLAEIGLIPREYNEFITFWYPRMKDNEYNLIHFADKEYTTNAVLTIDPIPDSMLRVFMVVKALEAPIEVKEQSIKTFTRTGFTLVEWGGTYIE